MVGTEYTAKPRSGTSQEHCQPIYAKAEEKMATLQAALGPINADIHRLMVADLQKLIVGQYRVGRG